MARFCLAAVLLVCATASAFTPSALPSRCQAASVTPHICLMAARATPPAGRGRGSKATKKSNPRQQRGGRGSKAAAAVPTTAAERRAAAEAKREKDFKKRKAGVALLKSLAQLSRDRKARREKYAADLAAYEAQQAARASNPAARASKPADARTAGPAAARAPPQQTAPADADATDGNPASRLLSTLGELAAAKAELALLQQKEALEDAAQRVRDAPGELLKGLSGEKSKQ